MGMNQDAQQGQNTREDVLFSLFDSGGHGLEIGPGFNPLVPRSKGFNAETLDHADQQALQKKYSNVPNVDIRRIEPVDHVAEGSSIAETVGKIACYDYIVASHVIEHVPDLVGFLIDCEKLLKPQGRLVLAVPDKRFSFDVFRSLTSTGDVLQAHLEGRTRHSPGTVFDEIAYNAVRDGSIAWPRDFMGKPQFFKPLNFAQEIFESYKGSENYLDLHAWQFTPSSFRLIVEDLYLTSHIKLRENSFVSGTGGEFFTSLSREGEGPTVTRIDLATQMMREHYDIKFSNDR